MRNHSNLRLAVVLALAGGILAACTFPGSQPSVTDDGCSPIVPAGYRTQAVQPMGTLEIHVTDAGGSPLASVSVAAHRNVPTTAKCSYSLEGITNHEGVFRQDRLKTGPYWVYVYNADKVATASTSVEDGKIVSVAVIRP